MKKFRLLGLLCLSLFFGKIRQTQAATGDTSIIFSHYNATIVTDPSAGSHAYPQWTVFPSAQNTFRKIILHINYKCPPGKQCGEWDYLDYVYLRRMGGVNALSSDIEIARFITPYGNSFTSTWHAEFHLDVTDYAILLHDSIEVEYRHDGYETNTRGWLVNMYFEFIEGTPVMPATKFNQLWNGSFPYGMASNPIEDFLHPDTILTDTATRLMRMRILQSGHGADSTTGCAEFCSKQRTLLLNGGLLNQRNIWRTTCGLNPLYPQAGTWVYSRGNWCPGSWVFPDTYEAATAGGAQNVFDMNMASYTNSQASARYVVNAQVIEYGAYSHVNDASIEEVLSPNDAFEYGRMNPACDNARINIRNNGSAAITALSVKYGIVGMPLSTRTWTGNLLPNKNMELVLGDLLSIYPSYHTFKVYIESVNGVADEYNYDDTATTNVLVPPTYDSVFVFVFKTNLQPSQSSYTLKNSAGTPIYYRTGGLTANTTYRDTFHLAPGCYRFTFNDTGNDGLSFWANPNAGAGTARFNKLNNSAIKIFNPDFGSQIFQSFMVGSNPLSVQAEAPNEMQFDIFPNPSIGPVNIELNLPEAEDLKLEIFNSMGQRISSKEFKKFIYQTIEFDFSKFESGIYYARVTSNHFAQTKQIVVSK